MPLKLRTKKRPNKSRETDDETKGSNKLRKTKHACIVEADDSTRKRLESTLPKDHEDHIAEKGFNSLSHHNLVHKFVPMPQAVKIPDAKGAVDKEQRMGEARKVASVAIDQNKEEKEVVLEAQRENIRVHFAALMDICHLKHAELEPMYQKHKGRVVLRGNFCERRSGLVCCIHRARFVGISNDSRKK